jgi:phage shock protein PspC (stress-responsive transcriptional regulator)
MTMAVTNAHKDEHVVEGIEEGLATYLGISKSYVHIKFAGADAHAGHVIWSIMGAYFAQRLKLLFVI